MADPKNSNKKLKVAVLGAGGIARRRVLPALCGSDFVEVVRVMDVVGAEEVAQEFGVARACACESEVWEDAEVEAVYLATPVFLHAEQIRYAAEAGKAVFCEKPVSPNLDQTETALRICKEKKVPFMEGYMMNFHGAHTRIREVISAGDIGRPVSMRAQLSCWYPPIEGAWRQDPKRGGGGALIDLATHCFSLLEYLTGDRIVGVFSMTTSQVQDYKSEDSASTLLQFASGCHATVDTLFCVRDEVSKNRLEIYGDSGGILAEGTIGQDDGGRVEALTHLGESQYDADQSRSSHSGYAPLAFDIINPYLAEWDYFATCLREGKPVERNGLDEARHIAQVTDAAYRSWQERKWINLG